MKSLSYYQVTVINGLIVQNLDSRLFAGIEPHSSNLINSLTHICWIQASKRLFIMNSMAKIKVNVPRNLKVWIR